MLEINEINKAICRKSYYRFLTLFWDTIITEKLQDNWHVEYLCDELQKVGERIIERKEKEYDLIINVPPGESKSTICTILFPVWLWIKDPSLRVISGSYSSSLSIEHATKSRDVIRSERFQNWFGELFKMKGDRDNKSHYGNDNNGERKATSTGGAVTGSHAHLLLIDDPINPKQAASDVLRKTANDWIDKTLSTRKVDAKITPTILIMQRLAEDDPTGVKIQQFTDNPNLKIKHICLPASDEFPVIPSELKGNYINGLLNPLRKDREVLSEFLAKLGTREFAAQMGQQPSPIEGNLVKESWFRYYEKAELLKEINLGRTKVDFFIDGAYSEKSIKGNDPSAIIAFCKFEKNLYILNCIEFWKDFPDLIKYVPTYCKQQQASQKSIVIVEPKANGKSIVQTLKKAKGIDLNVIEGVSPSDSKVVRLTAKTAFIEAERVFLPRGETWVESFIVQCLAFPNSKHDDKIDCLIGAIEKVQTKGKTKYATV